MDFSDGLGYSTPRHSERVWLCMYSTSQPSSSVMPTNLCSSTTNETVRGLTKLSNAILREPVIGKEQTLHPPSHF